MKLPLQLPDTDWRPVVDAWAASPAGQRLQAFLEERVAAGATIYPPEPLRALTLTPLPARSCAQMMVSDSSAAFDGP